MRYLVVLMALFWGGCSRPEPDLKFTEADLQKVGYALYQPSTHGSAMHMKTGLPFSMETRWKGKLLLLVTSRDGFKVAPEQAKLPDAVRARELKDVETVGLIQIVEHRFTQLDSRGLPIESHTSALDLQVLLCNYSRCWVYKTIVISQLTQQQVDSYEKGPGPEVYPRLAKLKQ